MCGANTAASITCTGQARGTAKLAARRPIRPTGGRGIIWCWWWSREHRHWPKLRLCPWGSMMLDRYACPCCGYKTLLEKPPGTFEICPVCFWEDDSVQFDDVEFEGGANRLSLRQSQRNFLAFGACEREFIGHGTSPDDFERDSSWQPISDSANG